MPGEQIAEEIITSDSAGFTTTETVVGTLVVPMVSGRRYRIWAFPKWESTVAGDRVIQRFRQTSVSGTIEQSDNVSIPSTSNLGFGGVMSFGFNASSSGNQTFVLAGVRGSGTGTCKLGALTSRPVYLLAFYVSG
jgi:hypothetical protein